MLGSLFGDIKLGSRICVTGAQRKILLHNRTKSESAKLILVQQVLVERSFTQCTLQGITLKQITIVCVCWRWIDIIMDAKERKKYSMG